MKIKIDDIPEEGLSLDLVEAGDSLVGSAAALEFKVEGEVHAHLDISKVCGLVSVEGSLSAETVTECSRCLKPVGSELTLRIQEKLLLSAEGAGGGEGKERELSLRDMDYTVMEAPELDTGDILLEQIVLASQAAALCREDCKGLCYSCGKDLNVNPCQCVESAARSDERSEDGHTDKRFAKLKGLKLK